MILRLESVGSTQTELIERIRAGDFSHRGIVAMEQTEGRGRQGRSWFSPLGSCLALSFWVPLSGLRPELIGMWAAIAAANSIDCNLQWPNDLVIGSKKVGGVIAETAVSPSREKFAVVGIGINLSVREFPLEICDRATSLLLEGRDFPSAVELSERILVELDQIPVPTTFDSIREYWMRRDATPGKQYRLPDGRIGEAKAVGAFGQLVAECGDVIVEVTSAEVWAPMSEL
jgi:BirA family biotin operon repressor/biotin-[acetyl-CoA-carboxylase] ligase